jgi:hypothetical protein
MTLVQQKLQTLHKHQISDYVAGLQNQNQQLVKIISN